MSPARRSLIAFATATGLSFLAATTGSDVLARTSLARESLTEALSNSLYYAAVQPILTLMLLWPFVLLGGIAFVLERRISVILAWAYLAVSVSVLGWLYFVGHWEAQQALQQQKWTAATLSSFFLAIESLLVIIPAALLATFVLWRWRREA